MQSLKYRFIKPFLPLKGNTLVFITHFILFFGKFFIKFQKKSIIFSINLASCVYYDYICNINNKSYYLLLLIIIKLY